MVERSADQRHLILFDGGCGFCGRAIDLVSRYDVKRNFRCAPIGSDESKQLLAKCGISATSPNSLLVFRSAGGKRSRPMAKGAAMMFIASRLRWPWSALALARWLPSKLLDWGYDHVARSRFMLSGASQSCALPSTDPERRRSG